MKQFIAVLFIILLFPTVSYAAPDDVYLQAKPADKPWEMHIQAGIEFMNETFDAFDYSDALDESSKYQAGFIKVGSALGQYVWLEGSYRQRDLAVGSIDANIDSWQIAGQFQLVQHAVFQLAARASLWGNSTDDIDRRYNLLSGSTRTSHIYLEKPQDKQQQIDIIGGFTLTEKTRINLFMGAGKSKVTFDNIYALGSFGGCEYNMEFTNTGYLGTLAKPCYEDVVITRIYSDYDDDDVRPQQELRYDANFYQAGINGQWQNDQWRLRLGYIYSRTKRDHVDDAIEKRSGIGVNNNHIIAAEIALRIWRNLSVSLAGQYLHKQFTGEMPFIYNSITSKHFNHRYGMLSTGILLEF